MSKPTTSSCAVAVFLAGVLLSALPVPEARAEQPAPAAGEPVSVLGVYPALPLAQLDQLFSPIAREIGQGLQRAIHFQSSSTYEKYSGRLDRGEFDIALVHPFDYLRHAQRAGYIPVVRKNEELTAIFVVPVDSPLRRLADLRGRTVALPPPGAAVSILAETELVRSGLAPKKDLILKHFGEHDSSLQNAVIGKADAAVTCRAILRINEAAFGARFRIIAETAAIPHSLFVVHSRVPEKQRELIRKILLGTTLATAPADLRKAFVLDGQAAFVDVSAAEIAKLNAYPLVIEKRR